MKKDRFLWSAHRITERQKAGKARSIKEKQLKNSRNTVSKPHVALLSSASDNQTSARDKIHCFSVRLRTLFCRIYRRFRSCESSCEVLRLTA
jgi:hypothetical protein